jgi:hypothetical protein
MSLCDDPIISVNEVAEIIFNELQVLNPMLYEEPNDPRLINMHIILDTHTVINVYGSTWSCKDIDIYHNMNNCIRKPTKKERETNWYNYRQELYCDDIIFSDSNQICEIDISKKSQIDNAIQVIKQQLENLGYSLYETEYVLK